MLLNSVALINDTDSSEETYRTILSIVYPVFLGTTLLDHSFLLLLIIFVAHNGLKTLRVLLSVTSILDILATSANFFIQPRIVSGYGGENIPVYCYGMCRHFDARFCFAIYMVWQTTSLAVGLSMADTLFYKYYKLKYKVPLVGWHLYISLLAFYSPCIVSMICSAIIILRNTLPDEAMKRSVMNMTIDSTEYIVIGKMTLGAVPNQINLVMMVLGIYVGPLVSFYLRYKAGKHLGTLHLSMNSQKGIMSVMKSLLLQVSTHAICYMPLFSLYIFSVKFDKVILFQQFFLAISPNLAATLDALFNLFYVGPFRRQIRKWVLGHLQTNTMPVISAPYSTPQ